MNSALAETHAPAMRRDDVATEIAALAPWHQNIVLPDGTATAPSLPGADQPRLLWEQFRDFLPADLEGCTALDIGCGAGFYVRELALRGAHVTATDPHLHHLRQARWVMERSDVASRVDLYRSTPYELARWRGRHEVVLLLGQLCSARYPQLALDIAAQLTLRCLVLHVPGAARAAADATGANAPRWWTPNEEAIHAMVRQAGFTVVARPGANLYLCQPARSRHATERRFDREFAAATGALPLGPSLFADELGFPPAEAAPLTVVESPA